jgi:hypothetical protein
MTVLRHWLEADEKPRCQHCPALADECSFMCEDCAAQADEEVQTLRDQLQGAVEERDKLLRRALRALGGEGRTSRHLVARQIEAFLDPPGGQ